MTDGRKAKAWWHDEARQMKIDGATIDEIADKFGKHSSTVEVATKGIKSRNKASARRFTVQASGVSSGQFKRIIASFDDRQVSVLNKLACDSGKSISAMISALVDEALFNRSFYFTTEGYGRPSSQALTPSKEKVETAS